jgi:hypothetical protein
MGRRLFSASEVDTSRLNNQRVLSGTSAQDLELGVAYFLHGVEGSAVTVKDRNDNVIVVFSNSNYFNNPIRIDDGIKMSAGSTAYLVYSTLRYDL